jgi:hypothetical protein
MEGFSMFSIRRWFARSSSLGLVAAALFGQSSFSLAQTNSAPTPTKTAAQDLPPAVAPITQVKSALGSPVTTDTVTEATAKPDPKQPVPAPQACPAAEPTSAWYTNPPYRVMPRPGAFNPPPTGCGYYSMLDWIKGDQKPAAPKSAYPAFALMAPSFFDADFRYVDDPNYSPDFLERLHRIHLGDDWLFGTGGQAQWRHMHEYDSRLTGKTNDYDLFRVRVFGDLWYKDVFRIYAEVISAGTANQDLPPGKYDENRFDFQNLFIDLKVGELDCHPVYVRAGRQEIMLGSQALISALDWANTRRTFQGVRSFWSNDHFDFDAFWLQPIIANNTGFSSVDHLQNFYGAFGTYRPQKGTAVDLYYLFLDNANHVTSLGITTAPTSVHTLGTRYSGDRCGFLWDFEGMVQVGQEGSNSIRAGSANVGLGYNFSKLPMNPTFWSYYNWASGTHDPNPDNYQTFNQLFPFNHYYYGFLDLTGGQNIRDWNVQMYLNPTKWITFNAQYHFFSLDAAKDAMYNAAGVPILVSKNGTAGGVIGQELDLLVNFHLSNRTDFQVGYSKLNAGEFIKTAGNGKSPELFYLMYNVRW